MKNTSSYIKTARVLKVLLSAFLALALLYGCGGPAPTVSDSPTPSATEGSAKPKPPSTLALPMPDGAELGNPLLATTREMDGVCGLIYESLLTTDDSGNLAPCLAETWKPNDDGTQYTFTLRKDVKWQGAGRNLTADDVKYTLEQIKALGQDKPWGYVTKNYLKSWKVNDDGTLTITLYKPFYGALQALTFPVLPKGCGYDSGASPEIPVGTGPYMVTGYDKGKTITLKAYPDWWKKQPAITGIKVQAFPDNATEISSLTLGGGQLDAMQTDDLTVTQYRDSGDANVYEYPTRYFEFMALNFSSPDIKDRNIRQAIAYALDRKEIVSYTYVNHAIVCDTPVPPDSWLYDGKVLTYNNDVSRARELIELAGWKDEDRDGFYDTSPDGVNRELKFTLLANMEENNTLRNDAAQLIAGQLAKAGIRVTVDAENWDNYNTELQQGRFDMAMCGCYLSPVPDYTFLIGAKGALNVGKYSSGDMDQKLAAVLQSPDSKTLQVNMADLQTEIINELPIISLYFRTHSLLTSTDVKGVSGVREDSAYSGISQWMFR